MVISRIISISKNLAQNAKKTEIDSVWSETVTKVNINLFAFQMES